MSWASLNLLEMARQFGVQRFVFGRSLSVYGTLPRRGTRSRNNTALLPRIFMAQPNSTSSSWGRPIGSRYGLEFVSLRIGRVVGPGSRSAFISMEESDFRESAIQPVDRNSVAVRSFRTNSAWFTSRMSRRCWQRWSDAVSRAHGIPRMLRISDRVAVAARVGSR